MCDCIFLFFYFYFYFYFFGMCAIFSEDTNVICVPDCEHIIERVCVCVCVFIYICIFIFVV